MVTGIDQGIPDTNCCKTSTDPQRARAPAMSERAYGRAAMPEKNTITTDTFQSLLVPSQAVMCTTASSVSAPPGAPPQWPHNSGYMAVIVRAQPYIQSQSYCSHALVTHRSQTCIRLVAAVHVSSILLSSESSVIHHSVIPFFYHPILLSSILLSPRRHNVARRHF